jgi:DNA mismatch endonuclease (patch repair protein)
MADVMTPEQRSAFMSNIRPKGTALEKRVFVALRRAGLRFRPHVMVLPRCTPDIVIKRTRVVVLIHGDFWHGWRFPAWSHKLAPFWREKIAINRARDARNHRALKREGWRVLRVWEHEIERDLRAVVERIVGFAQAEQRRGFDQPSFSPFGDEGVNKTGPAMHVGESGSEVGR